MNNSKFISYFDHKYFKFLLKDIQVLIIILKRYYKKTDLPKKYEIYMDSISEHEIFATEHSDYAYIDTIDGLCKVLTFDEYNDVIYYLFV